MRSNLRTIDRDHVTHEGGPADHITKYQELRRSVMACMLFEDTFYESGQDIADRIKRLVHENRLHDVGSLAVEARSIGNLRHAPLLLLCHLSDHPNRGDRSFSLSDVVDQTIQRADEMGELLSLYWKIFGRNRPVPAAFKRGLAKAFRKFDEYQLAKYDRRSDAVKLRDILRICHPKPENSYQAELWNRVIRGTLAAPDTWEVALSTGGDKRESFERLLREQKLGYMALLRNLRNMEKAGVDRSLVKEALMDRRGASRVFPFRFIAAIHAAPSYGTVLSNAMMAAIEGSPRLPGVTAVVVDTSGSMQSPLSARSTMNRRDAAAALACLTNGDEIRCFSFGDRVGEVPFFRGLSGFDRFEIGRYGHGTDIGRAVEFVNSRVNYDRIIVITDEQTMAHTSRSGRIPAPTGRGYMMNVGPYGKGIGYSTGWVHVDGFSDQLMKYIMEVEGLVSHGAAG